MKVTIQSIRFDASDKLQAHIEKKCNKLGQIFDRITEAMVFLKLEKDDHKGNKIVEIKLNVPGDTLIAKDQKSSFEEATDSCTDKLKQQLKRYKEKIRTH